MPRRRGHTRPREGVRGRPSRPMSESERTTDPAALKKGDGNGNRHRGATVVHLPRRGGGGEPPTRRGGSRGGDDGDGPRRSVRIRKLRVLALLVGLALLAMVSTVFGMMMAV